MENEDIKLTVAEELELANYLKGAGNTTPMGDEKHNVHKFLHDVAMATDTIKLGNVTEIELGNPDLPIRSYKELELFCNDVASDTAWGEYFGKQAEIVTSTSLSKDAKLIELAVTTSTQISDKTRKPMKENKGWFKKKGTGQQQEQTV